MTTKNFVFSASDENIYPGQPTYLSSFGLWSSDGTDDGTFSISSKLKNKAGNPTNITNLGNGYAMFSATDENGSRRLWVTDGSIENTRPITEASNVINPFKIDSVGQGFAIVSVKAADGHLDFWLANSAASGIVPINGIALTKSSSGFDYNVTPIGYGKAIITDPNRIYTDSTNTWTFDYNENKIQDFNNNQNTSIFNSNERLNGFASVGNGNIVFKYTTFDNDKGYDVELGVSNGTTQGIHLLKNISLEVQGISFSSHPSTFVSLGDGRAVFMASDNNHGESVFVTDGTSAGTQFVKDLFGDGRYHTGTITNGYGVSLGDGYAMFKFYENGKYTYAITNGFSSGTKFVDAIFSQAPFDAYNKQIFGIGNGNFIFVKENPDYTKSVVVSDGSLANTKVLVQAVYPGYPNSISYVGNGRVAFSVNDPVSGVEPWITDGTAEGTKLLKDVYPGSFQYTSGPHNSLPKSFTSITDSTSYLFTPSKDKVNFNNLLPDQKASISSGADIYHGLGGSDEVILPNRLHYNDTLGSSGRGLGWIDGATFFTQSKLGNTYTITGSDGVNSIQGGVGTEIIQLSSGSATIYGSAGSDQITGGSGQVIIDYQHGMHANFSGFIGATSQKIDISSSSFQTTSPLQDVLLLPGSANNYDFRVTPFTSSIGDQSWLSTHTTVYTRPESGLADVHIDTQGVERVKFANPLSNVVILTSGSIAAEMMQLNDDAYGGLQLFHRSQPLGSLDLANTSMNPGNKSPLQRGWHAVSAIELGMAPTDYGLITDTSTGSRLSYSLNNGTYQAIALADTFGGDASQADALVVSGIIGGKTTLAISIRGTDQLADFADYGAFQTHLSKFQPLIDAVNQYVADPTNHINQVLIGGHSLGGATAQLLAGQIAAPSMSVYTDGSPGAENGSQSLPINNYVHTNDPIGNYVQYASTITGKAVLLSAVTAGVLVVGALTDGPQVLTIGALSALKNAGLSPGEALGTLTSIIAGASKVHDGSTIYINTGSAIADPTDPFAGHARATYTNDIKGFLDFIRSEPSSAFALSSFATSLKNNVLYTGPDLHIGVTPALDTASPTASHDISIDAADNYDIGDAAANTFSLGSIALLTHASTLHIDGGLGADTLRIASISSLYEKTSTGDGKFSITSLLGSSLADVTSVETLHFLDGDVSFDVNSLVGTVYALYDGLLGRAADPAGLSYWVDQIDHGTSVRDLGLLLLNSAEGLLRFGSADETTFVQQLYQNTLYRVADPRGLSYWADQLAHGTARIDVADNFVFSAEHVGNLKPVFDAGILAADPTSADVARLYYTMLNRPPDADGLDYWTTQIDHGGTVSSVAQTFLSTPENQSKYGSLGNGAYVDALYVNAVGRHADSGGQAYWTDLLNHGTSRADLATLLAQSAEAHSVHYGQIEGGWQLA